MNRFAVMQRCVTSLVWLHSGTVLMHASILQRSQIHGAQEAKNCVLHNGCIVKYSKTVLKWQYQVTAKMMPLYLSLAPTIAKLSVLKKRCRNVADKIQCTFGTIFFMQSVFNISCNESENLPQQNFFAWHAVRNFHRDLGH